MIYKLTSSKEIIAKVMADLDIKEDLQRETDMHEWISEAVEKIGAVTQLKRVVSGSDEAEYLEIKNYQAQLPTELFRLNNVMYSVSASGPWTFMKKSSGNFSMWPSVEIGPKDRIIQDQVLIDAVKVLYQKYVEDPIYSWFSKMDYKTALEILNTNSNVRTLLTNLINAAGNPGVGTSSDGLVYMIKPGYIVTNIPSGFLKLSYDALYTDEDGYLLIPDLASYKEALYWYVVMKLKYPEYLSGRMNREIYYDIRRSWNFYCKQAYGEAMMPTQDDMENIKNDWVRLVPDMKGNDKSFENLGSKEYLYSRNN